MGALALPAAAQMVPSPCPDTPRVQTLQYQPNTTVVLTALPLATLTVTLEPGEMIQRATLGESNSWDVSITTELDSFQVTPKALASPARLFIETNVRSYTFTLETGEGLLAAYLVRFRFGEPSVPPQHIEPLTQIHKEGLDWSYRVRGDRSVRPASIRDDGKKTVIEYGVGQSLPAVFAIGPSGDEEVVDGYMRHGKFVIDRVHPRLVFRIDKEKATARRNSRKDGER